MTTRYRVAEVNGYDRRVTLQGLHIICLPYDDIPDFEFGRWWLATLDGIPAAFAGYQPSRTEDSAVYLCRAGVLPDHRGHGLQRRLIDARTRAAAREGQRVAITTTFDNPPSSNNLIRAGFLMYEPDAPWGIDGTCYWRRALHP